MLTADKAIQALVLEAKERLMEAGCDSVVILTTRYDRQTESTYWHNSTGGNSFAGRELAFQFATGELDELEMVEDEDDSD